MNPCILSTLLQVYWKDKTFGRESNHKRLETITRSIIDKNMSIKWDKQELLTSMEYKRNLEIANTRWGAKQVILRHTSSKRHWIFSSSTWFVLIASEMCRHSGLRLEIKDVVASDFELNFSRRSMNEHCRNNKQSGDSVSERVR